MEITNEAFKAAKISLEKQGRTYGLGRFGIVNNEGKEYTITEGACYASFDYSMPKCSVKNPTIFTTFPSKTVINVNKENLFEKSKVYLEWLLNDSFVAENFITKDAEEAYNKGVMMGCNYTPNRIIMAAIMFRYIWEFPDQITAWTEMKEYVNPDAAMYMIKVFSKDKKNDYWTIGGPAIYGHSWIELTQTYYTPRIRIQIPTSSDNALKNIIKHKLPKYNIDDYVHNNRFNYTPLQKALIKTVQNVNHISLKFPKNYLEIKKIRIGFQDEDYPCISKNNLEKYFNEFIILNTGGKRVKNVKT